MIERVDTDTRPRLARKARLRYDDVRSQDLLLLPERVVKLNKTAADILKLCDGVKPISEITSELEKRYNQSGLESDVIEFVEDVRERGWLE